MRRTLFVASALLLSGILFPRLNFTQEKPAAEEPKMTPEDAAKKNPIAPTAESLAEARKFFGYNCAMCHGKDGSGKGDLAQDMKLELHDWRDASSIEKMTDGELFWIITNGKGKMPGNGEREKENMRWKYVNLVRSFGKKGAAVADKPKSETAQPQN
jgi:mono/diheme cytochrome c family protein